MSKQLTGEIIWYGSEKKVITARISGYIDETLIKLTTEQNEYTFGYEVTIIRKEIGTLYEGNFIFKDEQSIEGVVECEVFKSMEGKDKYVLSGNWYEGENYFWYTKMSFKNFPDD